MLEGSFDHNADAFRYHHINRLKEDIIQTPVEIRPKRGMRATQGMHIAFFELITAQCGAVNVLRQRMGKRRFPCAGPTGHHNYEWLVHGQKLLYTTLFCVILLLSPIPCAPVL